MATGRPWVKGQSGNPSGRPKWKAEVQRAMRTHLESPDMVAAWAAGYRKLLDDAEPSIIRDYADRVLGKATEPAQLETTTSLPTHDLSAEEVRELIRHAQRADAGQDEH